MKTAVENPEPINFLKEKLEMKDKLATTEDSLILSADMPAVTSAMFQPGTVA